MSLAANAARMIARKGETITLNRDGETSITLKGKRSASGSLDAVGNTSQQGFKVRISTTELAASDWAVKAPSASGDTLTVGGRIRAVIDVTPLKDGETVAMYEIEVAG